MSQSDTLKTLLADVSQGVLSPDAALEKLKYLTYEPVADFAKIDHHRALRTGFPEVIWGPGKTPAQIVQIMQTMRTQADRLAAESAAAPIVMATRIESEVYHQIHAQLPEVVYYETARICALGAQASASRPPQYPGTIGILCAGTADLPVAEEAAVTATLSGFQVKKLWDVGVAGIHRLLSNLHLLTDMNVVIVVAGMEGALPSVVAGLSDCPIVAVPTSVGYGANFHGLSALLTMLNSCATGIGVVNIDNGFGAAMLAGQILRAAAKLQTDVADS